MQCYAKVNRSIREILQSFHVNLREFVDERYKVLWQNHAIGNVYLLSQTITDMFMTMHSFKYFELHLRIHLCHMEMRCFRLKRLKGQSCFN